MIRPQKRQRPAGTGRVVENVKRLFGADCISPTCAVCNVPGVVCRFWEPFPAVPYAVLYTLCADCADRVNAGGELARCALSEVEKGLVGRVPRLRVLVDGLPTAGGVQ